MKTILLKKYLKILANLNDQLCYFQFNRNELNKKLNNFGTNAKKLYLPDVFAQNDMAPRINVTLEKLLDFQLENETVTFGSYISTSYEVTSNYLKDGIQLLKDFNPLTCQLSNSKELEEKYILTLTNSSYNIINREIIDTLKYIRLRRNHFTHIADSISPSFSSLITTQGNILNNYWSGTINSLDFTSTNILSFKEEETIDIIKLLKIIVERIDINLISNLSKEGIITYLSKKEFENNPQKINSDVIKQRTKRILVLSKHEFGITLLENEIEPIVKVIGTR